MGSSRFPKNRAIHCNRQNPSHHVHTIVPASPALLVQPPELDLAKVFLADHTSDILCASAEPFPSGPSGWMWISVVSIFKWCIPPSLSFADPESNESAEDDFLDDAKDGNTLLRESSMESHGRALRKRTWKVGVQPARMPVPASIRPQ